MTRISGTWSTKTVWSWTPPFMAWARASRLPEVWTITRLELRASWPLHLSLSPRCTRLHNPLQPQQLAVTNQQPERGNSWPSASQLILVRYHCLPAGELLNRGLWGSNPFSKLGRFSLDSLGQSGGNESMWKILSLVMLLRLKLGKEPAASCRPRLSSQHPL